MLVGFWLIALKISCNHTGLVERNIGMQVIIFVVTSLWDIIAGEARKTFIFFLTDILALSSFRA